MTVTLGHLADMIGGTVLPAESGGPADPPIAAVELNAAETPEGGLFAALPGTRVHGATYAHQSPAAAILTDADGLAILRESGELDRPVLLVDDVRAVLGTVSAEVHGRPSEKLTVIGVTGTSGKTTTTYLLEAALLASGKRTGLIGTTGTRINGRTVPSHLTTPEAPALQRLFDEMVSDGVTHVVMEVSSHALSLGRVDGVSFDVTCFLNLSQDHLDFHDGLEDYFNAKAALFRPDSPLHAARVADVVIVTDDNPRTEDPRLIREAVTQGAVEAAAKRAAAVGIDPIRVENIGDRAEAIDVAIGLAGAGDAVVVAGKGHETGQEINGVQHHFDDREQVRAALRRRAGAAPGTSGASAATTSTEGEGED